MPTPEEMGLPNTYDLQRFQDIHLQDQDLLKDYISNYQVGSVNTAHQIIESNPQGIGKAFTAKTLNAYTAAILDLEQKTIQNGTETLDEMLALFQSNVDNFKFSGSWTLDQEYTIGNFVYAPNGDVYMALKDGAYDITDSTAWMLIGLKGEQGNLGFGLEYKGKYNPERQYEPGNLVVYENGLYVSKTTNTGVTPGSSPSDWCVALTIEERGIFVSDTEPADIRTGDYWWQVLDTPTYPDYDPPKDETNFSLVSINPIKSVADSSSFNSEEFYISLPNEVLVDVINSKDRAVKEQLTLQKKNIDYTIQSIDNSNNVFHVYNYVARTNKIYDKNTYTIQIQEQSLQELELLELSIQEQTINNETFKSFYIGHPISNNDVGIKQIDCGVKIGTFASEELVNIIEEYKKDIKCYINGCFPITLKPGIVWKSYGDSEAILNEQNFSYPISKISDNIYLYALQFSCVDILEEGYGNDFSQNLSFIKLPDTIKTEFENNGFTDLTIYVEKENVFNSVSVAHTAIYSSSQESQFYDYYNNKAVTHSQISVYSPELGSQIIDVYLGNGGLTSGTIINSSLGYVGYGGNFNKTNVEMPLDEYTKNITPYYYSFNKITFSYIAKGSQQATDYGFYTPILYYFMFGRYIEIPELRSSDYKTISKVDIYFGGDVFNQDDVDKEQDKYNKAPNEITVIYDTTEYTVPKSDFMYSLTQYIAQWSYNYTFPEKVTWGHNPVYSDESYNALVESGTFSSSSSHEVHFNYTYG